jgi:prepilin-type N-terminal cleavage/methylation domain-containing protein
VNRRRRITRSSRGFSLLELCIVVAIIAIIASLTIPALRGSQRVSRQRTMARQINADLRFARNLSVTGARLDQVVGASGPSGSNPQSPSSPQTQQQQQQSSLMAMPAPDPGLVGTPTGPGPGVPAGDLRVREGGIRVISTTQYTIFADADTTPGNGNEYDFRVVDLQAEHPEASLSITYPPAGTEIRFQSNGTRDTHAAGAVVVHDALANVDLRIEIANGGQTQIR